MDYSKYISKLLACPGSIPTPGCQRLIATSPIDPNSLCLDVGVVFEHRFAFYYWCQYHKHSLSNNRYCAFRKPTLITIDWHDDVGVETDYSRDDILGLNVNNDLDVYLFSWTCLRRMNDGNILPALMLSFFSDVYVLLKQDNGYNNINTQQPEKTHCDVNGEPHCVYYYNDQEQLLEKIKDAPEQFFFLDIDMDYFMEDANNSSPYIVPEREIREFFSKVSPLFTIIIPRLVGMTLALEPDYCNGIHNSLIILNILNSELFSGTLFSSDFSLR